MDGPKHIDTTLTGVKFAELGLELLDRYAVAENRYSHMKYQ